MVRAYGQLSAPFDITTGVRQGALLSPELFKVAMDWVMRNALEGLNGVHSWNGDMGITDLDYADDIAVMADCPVQLQTMLSRIIEYGARVGLVINAAKTKVLVSDAPPPVITANGAPLEVVDSFRYLGCLISSNGDCSPEIRSRIGRAWDAFECLKKEVWCSRVLSMRVKLLVYDCVVRNVLLYGCETWPEKVADFARLEAFQMKCYRRILGINFRQRVPNVEVLRRVNRSAAPTIEAIIQQRRLRWFGHVLRMGPSRLPYRVLRYSVPGNWRRGPGGRRATFLGTIEKDLMPYRDIYRAHWYADFIGLWETIAGDRAQFKKMMDDL
jgi:hypothetical protein